MHVTLTDANGYTHDVHDIPDPLPRGMRRVGRTEDEKPGVREYHRVGSTSKYREATTHFDMTKAHCAADNCASPKDHRVLFAAPYKDGVAFVCADCYPQFAGPAD